MQFNFTFVQDHHRHARTPTQLVTLSPRGYLLGFILASPLAAAYCSVLEGGKVSWPLCSEKQSSVILFIVFLTGGFLPALFIFILYIFFLDQHLTPTYFPFVPFFRLRFSSILIKPFLPGFYLPGTVNNFCSANGNV